jgi:hypothetical protein
MRIWLLLLVVCAACHPPRWPRNDASADARGSADAGADRPPGTPPDGAAGGDGPAGATDAAGVDQAGAPGPCAMLLVEPELPTILDCTRWQPNAQVPALVRRAIAGLGFPPNEGPRSGDLVFVGDQYMAWVDRTGYHGKLNALWPLNGDMAALDFTLVEPTLSGEQRPVNVFLPGEDGDGRWPVAYAGAEHYEIPRYKGGAHVAQAGLREANHFGSTAPETWRQCMNVDSSIRRWDAELGHNEFEVRPDGTVAVSNRAPLAIVARFRPDAYACGSAFPFNNEQAGQMELVQGYVFDPRGGKIERNYQLVNRSTLDYQSQTTVDKLIGGMLLTDWPRPHYLKQFQRYGAWDSDALALEEPFPYAGTGQTGDHIDVHEHGKRWLSATPKPIAGRSIRIEQATGQGDVGHCLCRVHGGMELGGSVLKGLMLPGADRPDSPTVGPVHRRDIFLDGDRAQSTAKVIQSRLLQAEEPGETLHQVGAAEGPHWVARTGDAAGFLYYRNYLPVTGGATGQAVFTMSTDEVMGADEPVVRIDLVHDRAAVIASRELRRSEFRADGVQQRFVLDFQVPVAGGDLEPRVTWLGKAPIRLDGIVLNWLGSGM